MVRHIARIRVLRTASRSAKKRSSSSSRRTAGRLTPSFWFPLECMSTSSPELGRGAAKRANSGKSNLRSTGRNSRSSRRSSTKFKGESYRRTGRKTFRYSQPIAREFPGAGDFQADSPSGRNLHFGVREHSMGAILNGLALSKLRPFGSGFLIFSDYGRGAIRLSALMEIPVTHVFTHDSI